MPVLSIIVPVYNKEAYIDACISSILQQSFKDFELILINDGSTDSSGLKCAYYQTIDKRITVVNQPNSGVSAARNAGLALAKGKYLGFIDSDDTIEPDMYELLIRNALNTNADISVCRMRVIFPGKLISPAESGEPIVFGHDDAIVFCLNGDFDRSANNKIYKTEIGRNIKFEGHIYEDILYTCKAFLMAKTTVFENTVKYNYIVRENSASMTKFNLKYMETISVSAKMLELVSEKNNDCIVAAQNFDITANISLLNLLLLSKPNKYKSQYNQVVNNLKRYKSFISSANSMSRKHKYAFILFSISPFLYTQLMYLYCFVSQNEVLKRT